MASAPDIDEPLPELLQRVADAAGISAALLLAREFGGTRIYIPATLSEDSPLVRAVGIRAAQEIVSELGRGHQVIPLGPNASFARVRRAIRENLAKGMSNARVARLLGCHERTVERERRRLRQAEAPPLLAILRKR